MKQQLDEMDKLLLQMRGLRYILIVHRLRRAHPKVPLTVIEAMAKQEVSE